MVPNGIVASQIVGLRPAEILQAPDHLYLQSPERYEFFDITDLTKRYVINLSTGQFTLYGGGGNAIPAVVSPTGPYSVGQTLTAALQPGWVATSFQWRRDGVPISGATSSTYTIVSGDAGTRNLDCLVINPSYAASGGAVSGSGGVSLGYDGGQAFSTYVSQPLDDGTAAASYSLPPIDGGSA